MIIGSGLIATAFQNFKNENYIIFASGVSNSLENSQIEFNREINLLKEIAKYKKKIVYFSTTALQQDLNDYTPYLIHKRNIEEILLKKNDIVIRLPQVVGSNQNHFNLIPFLYNSIKQEKHFYIKKNTFRSLLDIDDIVKLTRVIIEKKFSIDNFINFINPFYIEVLDIVKIIEKILDKPGKYKFIESKNSEKKIELCDKFESLINICNLSFDINYNARIIKKYYG